MAEVGAKCVGGDGRADRFEQVVFADPDANWVPFLPLASMPPTTNGYH